MNIERSYRLCLVIVGAFVLFGAFFHGIWYWFFLGYPEMAEIKEVQLNLIYLFSWSISFLLLFMSILSFIVALMKSIPLNFIRLFSLLVFLFWGVRLILEFIFPVKIPFVIIPNTSLFLKILIPIGLIIIAFPEFLKIKNDFSNQGK